MGVAEGRLEGATPPSLLLPSSPIFLQLSPFTLTGPKSLEPGTLNSMVGDFNAVAVAVAVKTNTLKFLCSYGGKILPRYTDGKLRYVGGQTRVLAVDRSIRFAELLVKLGELCGSSVSLRCQLPNEDIDALVSITSDEDLANLIEEYDLANMNGDKVASSAHPLKIRAFLWPPKSVKKISPPSSTSSFDAPVKSFYHVSGSRSILPGMKVHRCVHHTCSPVGVPFCFEKSAGNLRYYGYHAEGNPRRIYLVHSGNHSH